MSCDPTNPGKGYRLLNGGEELKSGDQCYWAGSWGYTIYVNPGCLAREPKERNDFYRRKLKIRKTKK